MLDLVRRTCPGAEKLDVEGIFEPDPEQVEAWKFEIPDVGDSFRFFNLPPQEVRRRLEKATDPEEIKALKLAEAKWQRNGGYGGGEMTAGTVERGEPRKAVTGKSLREVASSGERVTYVGVMGSLRSPGGY